MKVGEVSSRPVRFAWARNEARSECWDVSRDFDLDVGVGDLRLALAKARVNVLMIRWF